MAGINSRWRKGAIRVRSDRTIDDVRQVKDRDGHWQTERDAPTEVRWVDRRHAGPGWRNGARIRSK